MKNSIKTVLRVAVVAGSLAALSLSAQASIFSGWRPFRKPLEPAKKASEEVTKAISGGRQTLPPAAQQKIEEISEKAEAAKKEHEHAEETLGSQRDSFVLTAIGLLLTNLLTLGGLLRGGESRKLANETARLNNELLRAQLASAKAGNPPAATDSP